MKSSAAGSFSRATALHFVTFLVVSMLVWAAAFATLPVAWAADAPAGTLEPTTGALVEWHGTATGGVSDGEATCDEGVNCDTFLLTVAGAPADWAGKQVNINISWRDEVNDYDLYIHKDSVSGPLVTSSAAGFTTSEVAFIDPAASGTGVYAVHVVYFAATAADQYAGTAKTINKSTSGISTEAPPRFFNYAAPGGLGRSAGEPTLGVNWATGNVMFIAGLETLRVSFDDSSSPAQTTWSNKSARNTSITSFDPILFTDSDVGAVRTNRTFASQLLPSKVSLMSFTDDDGDTWTTSQGAGINSGVDHQMVGAGPYAREADGKLKGGAVQRAGADGKIYPHAVYYCSQDIADALCARSDDGGLTFGPAIPMYSLLECGGLHGHIKVARDGTLYVPNKSCGGKQAVVVSEDNGVTWNVRPVPGSTPGRTDPSLGIGEDGTIYFGYANGDGSARIEVSRDRGQTWENTADVGAQQGIKNTVFPAVIAGDSDRAAFFFLGTTTGGNGTGSDVKFTGAWYGYIATTYDGGRSWVTVNATPGDPVQRGSICTSGTTCPSTPVNTRNLLDFNDLTMDAQGRVLAGYADGCVTSACIQGADKNNDGVVNSLDNDGSELATIIRQAGGKGLLSAYDTNRSVPDAPQLVASLSGTAANLAWSTPDNGGSAITGYQIFRGVRGGSQSMIASVDAATNSYTDTASSTDTYYRVRALNANGNGVLSQQAFPTVPETACQTPGITVATDGPDAAPNSPAVPQVNIKTLQLAEPAFADGASKLVFTLKVGAGALPANSQWYVIWQRTTPDANHDRNYVALKTDLTGTPRFEHGRISYPLVFTSPAANQGNIPTTFGSAEGSYDAATGAITLAVRNEQVDNPVAGQSLLGLESRTFLGRNDSLPVNQTLSSDFAVGDTYTLSGNAACIKPVAAPTNLSTSVQRSGKPDNKITLSWKDNSDNESSFLIERSTLVDGGFEQIATVGANVSSFVDSSVQRKVTYYYRVRATSGSATSDSATSGSATSGYSNVASGQAK